MNEFANLPVIVLFDGEKTRGVQFMTRVPCMGEFLHFNLQNVTEKQSMGKVVAVTHLICDAQNPQAIAEIHCVSVEDLVPDRQRVLLAAEERSRDYGL